MGVTRPPLEYLATCSKVALESFELSRLNEASNLRKEVQQILQGWIDTEVDARLARWILETKQAQAQGRLQAAMRQPVPVEQLDISFLPLDTTQSSDEEAEENTRRPDPKPRRAARAVSSCTDGRASVQRQRSFGIKRAKLLEERAGGRSLSGSAPRLSVRKPPFAQDEENALHELEHFVQREPGPFQVGLHNFGAEKNSNVPGTRPCLAGSAAGHAPVAVNDRRAEVRVFPSTEAARAGACGAYPFRANSILASAPELAMPAAGADCPSLLHARLNVRTLICRPGLERARGKVTRPGTVCVARAVPAS